MDGRSEGARGVFPSRGEISNLSRSSPRVFESAVVAYDTVGLPPNLADRRSLSPVILEATAVVEEAGERKCMMPRSRHLFLQPLEPHPGPFNGSESLAPPKSSLTNCRPLNFKLG